MRKYLLSLFSVFALAYFTMPVLAYQSSTGGTSTGLHSLSGTVKTSDAYLSYMPIGGSVPSGPVESTPIVFNGALYTITSNSMSGTYQGTFRVDSMLHRPMVTVNAPGMQYPCAYVENGTIYVYGTDSTHQYVSVMTSSDLINWTAPTVVFTAPSGLGFYNTSVTKVGSGSYVMAVESTDAAYPGIPFVTHFLAGTSPTNWIMSAGLYNNNNFTNCPTIRYAVGKYYLLYMSKAVDAYFTFITRSADLTNWENGTGYPDGHTVPLAPTTTEGINNSDMDIVEFNGNVYMTFARGDQTSWLETTTAIWPGTLQQYLQSFFATNP